MCVDIVYIYDCGDRETNQYICHQNLDGPRFSEQCPNWAGIEQERREGSCNKCEMAPIPDHQPESGEDEIFPRSTNHEAHRPAGHDLGTEEHWTPQQESHPRETQKNAVSPQGTQQVGTDQRPRSQQGTHAMVQHGPPKSAHAPMKFTRRSRHSIADPLRISHHSTREQAQSHNHATNEEQDDDQRRCSFCSIL